jgi:hypothetical protein
MIDRSPTTPRSGEAPGEEPTLPGLLRGVARRTSDAQAAVAAGKGTLLAAGIMFFAPQWWRVGLVGVAVAAFGLWIVLERSGLREPLRSLAKGAAVVLGTTSAFVLGLSLLTLALGTWIS